MKSGPSGRFHYPILLYLAAALVAGGVGLWSMTLGIGVSTDSVIYLSAADRLISGEGLKPIAHYYGPGISSGQTLIAFPPIYPLALAATRVFTQDRLTGAKWTHALLLAASVFLIGMIVYLTVDRSALAGLSAIFLFLSSLSVLNAYTMMWSEPLFIFLLLSVLFLLQLHLQHTNHLSLFGSAFLAGQAMMTRYAGVTILVPLVLTILLVCNKRLGTRIKDCLIVLTIALLPLAAWLLRNKLQGSSATGRSFAFHLIGSSALKEIAVSLTLFFLPFNRNPSLAVAIATLMGCLVLAAMILMLKEDARSGATAPLFSCAFVTTYFVFLLAYNSFANPAVDLTPRVLLPIFVFEIVVLIWAAHRLSRLTKDSRFWWGFLFVVTALVAVNARSALSFMIHRHEDGLVFTSRKWTTSQSVQFVRTFASSKTVYSNGADAFYFFNRREALLIPTRFDLMAGHANAEFDRQMKAMRDEVTQNHAVIVYFDRIDWRWYLPGKQELEEIYKLPVLRRFDDGVIYGIELPE